MSGKNHAKTVFYKKVGSIGHEVYKHSHICNPNKWVPTRPNNTFERSSARGPIVALFVPDLCRRTIYHASPSSTRQKTKRASQFTDGVQKSLISSSLMIT